ncbi:MAG TPA: 7TM diverse intracellular signaling domain-containing protein [Ramlibacter sp.]|nr:7TM diverse intracellular signaling domain-containing protein [Ramlibacter sp.]
MSMLTMGFMEGGRKLLVAAVLLVAMLAAAFPSWARTVLDLDAAHQPVGLLDWGDAWIDPGGQATPDQVATDPSIAWAPTGGGAIYPLSTRNALWLRFTIPPAPDAERWYLEIPYTGVNHVTLYTQDSIGQWMAQSAGDTLAVADWPVPHRHPLLPVTVSAEEPRKFLLRVSNPHSFSAPLSFVSESYLSRREQRTSLILGIYFGLAGLAVAVGVLSAVSLRDSAYGFYALSVALMGLSQAAMTGIGGLHLWPHWPWWSDLAPLVLPVLAVGSQMWFFSAVVSMPQRSRLLHRVLAGLTLLSIAVAAGIILVEPSHRVLLLVPYVVLACVIGPLSIIWAARRGDRYALGLLAASLPVVIGSAFPLARVAGLIPVSFLTLHGMQVGIALELPVLLVLLMLRSQQRREHNRRIHGLDRIDPATGLINGEVFKERLARMMARSRRLKYESAVLLVDVVNIEQIRRDFGARSAEELPLRVAGRLLAAAREIDGVARLSDLRFGMLIEGPLSAQDAASAGPRVVARCLMPFKNKPIEWVAQVRVAQTLVPTERADAQLTLERLEALLAAVPADSKRAVFSLRS